MSSLQEDHLIELSLFELDYHETGNFTIFDQVCSKSTNLTYDKIPIINIYGPTSTGNSCCLHIHNVFPYIIVNNQFGEYNQEFLKKFAGEIDRIMNLSNLSNFNNQRQDCSIEAIIHDVTLIEARSLYGYHKSSKTFIRFSILISGIVMNQKFEIYEAHIPYLLQFLLDFNLYGMGLVTIEHPQKRSNLSYSSGSAICKESNCNLEYDCCSKSIMNRHEILNTTPFDESLLAEISLLEKNWLNSSDHEKFTSQFDNKIEKFFSLEIESLQITQIRRFINEISDGMLNDNKNESYTLFPDCTDPPVHEQLVAHDTSSPEDSDNDEEIAEHVLLTVDSINQTITQRQEKL